MFHPKGHPMERGWVGRIDGDRVVHLAAQTLQSFFTGGGSAREHAEYPLDGVVILAPVLHPAAVRVFEDQRSFSFANPAAIRGPGASIAHPDLACNEKSQGTLAPHGRGAGVPSDRRALPCNEKLQCDLVVHARVAAAIGPEVAIAGFTVFAEWHAPPRPAPKDRDFALGLGPVVVTPDEVAPDEIAGAVRVDGREELVARFERFDWGAALALAASGTTLRAGDLLAGPALGSVEVPPGAEVELELDGIGVLTQRVAD